MEIFPLKYYSYRDKIFNLLLFFLVIQVSIIYNSFVVEAHYIDDKNVEEGKIVDTELNNFKKLSNGLVILKPEEEENNDNNENENNGFLVGIVDAILDNFDDGNDKYEIIEDNPNYKIVEDKTDKEKDKSEEIKNKTDIKNDEIEKNGNKTDIKNDEIEKNGNETDIKNDEIVKNGNKTDIKNDEIVKNGNKTDIKNDEIEKNGNKTDIKNDEIENNGNKTDIKNDEINKNGNKTNIEQININDMKTPENKIDEKENKKDEDKKNEDKNLSVDDVKNKTNETKSDLKTDNKDHPKGVKIVKIMKDHKNYKFKSEEEKNNKNGKFIKIESGNNKNNNSNKDDQENDDDIKALVEQIIKAEGHTGEDAREKEKDLFQKVKGAITNSKLDQLAKAKEKDIQNGINFSKSSNKGNNKSKGVFKIEESYQYKCYFDQDCTNFKGFTPDIASCNKTSTFCKNYCFVQKACLENSDCSTSCGSWCLKESDMVFGHCVMSFDEDEFCMESWRVCKDGLVCNVNTYVCEKPRIPLTFTRIDSQESLLSIVIFLIIAILLIKNSRNRDFISFFSGYNLNEYCSNTAQEYDPLPEYQRTEELSPEEINELIDGPIGPPPEEGYVVENENEPLYQGYYDENNQSVNCNYIPVSNEQSPHSDQMPTGGQVGIVQQTIGNSDINIHVPSMESLSDADEITDPPPDYEE